MRKILLFLIIGIFLISLISASRLPTVGGDEDSWGTILNDLLSRIAGSNATELNLTMVNGTNIYSSAINSTHIIDNTIAASDIGLDVIDGSELADTITLDAMLNFINNSFAVNTSDLFVNISTGNVGIGTNGPNATLHVMGRIYQGGLGKSTYLGDLAGENDDGNDNLNVGVGYAALNDVTSGKYNTGVGYSVAPRITTGRYNTAIGYGSLAFVTSQYSNTAIGERALYLCGYQASGSQSQYNTGIGASALYNVKGSYNFGMGASALWDLTTGYNNTAIGYNTGRGITTGNNNVIIGAGVTGLASDLNNTIILATGNGTQRIMIDSNGSVGINTTTPGELLEVAGNINSTGGDICITGGNCLSDAGGAETDPHWTGNSTLVPYLASANVFTANNNFTGGISSQGSGANSEQFGFNANASSDNSLVIGNGAYTGTGDRAVVIGNGAYTGTGLYPIAIGYQAHTGNTNGATAIGNYAEALGVGSFAMGYSATASGNSAFAMGQGATTGSRSYSIAFGTGSDASGGNGAIAIGTSATAGGTGGIAIGISATSVANTFVAGGTNPTYGLTDVYFGYGITDEVPTSITYHATGGSGTNITGGNLILAGGKGTGAGDGGDILFQTSDTGSNGTTLQSLTTKAIIKNTGYVGINTTTPQNMLNIVGDVNATGNFISGANTGITGNYSIGTCWMSYSGGIMYSTNCTAL